MFKPMVLRKFLEETITKVSCPVGFKLLSIHIWTYLYEFDDNSKEIIEFK